MHMHGKEGRKERREGGREGGRANLVTSGIARAGDVVLHVGRCEVQFLEGLYCL